MKGYVRKRVTKIYGSRGFFKEKGDADKKRAYWNTPLQKAGWLHPRGNLPPLKLFLF
jgi:hypothetical protein